MRMMKTNAQTIAATAARIARAMRISLFIFVLLNECILFYGLEQRLAIFLVSEYERRGDAHINITHDSIAKYIGTSRERVTKTLKKMCDKNIIRKTKGCIEIINVENLCEIAESPPPPENSGGRTTFGLIPFGGA